MAFDVDGARKAGYSDAEIADHLGQTSKFDVGGARTAGYSDSDIIGHLTVVAPPSPEQERPSNWRIAAESPAKAVNTFADHVLNTPTRLLNFPIMAAGVAATEAGFPEYAPDTLPDPNFIRGAVGEGTKPVGALQENIDKAGQFATYALAGPSGAARNYTTLLQLLKSAVPGASRNAALGAASGSVGDVVGRATDSPTAEFVANVATPLGVAGGAKAAGLAAKVPKGAYHLAEPWIPGGVSRIKGRVLNEAAGSRRDAVIAKLQSENPGSGAIAGEVAAPAGSAEFSALQKHVAGLSPSEYNAISGAQQAGRSARIGEIAKTKQDLSAAESARGASANKDYGTAFAQQVKVDPTLAELSKNPYFRDALPDARKLAASKGINPKENLTEFLHLTKLSLDKALTRVGDTALSNAEKAQVQSVKNQLVKWLGDKNPAYDAARTGFAKASKPINEMQVGQILESKLNAPLGTAERASTFASAVREAPQTLKKATGQNRYEELSDVLTPEQVQAVQGVMNDLARKAQYEKLAVLGKEKLTKELGQQFNEVPPTGMFSPIISVARGVLNRAQGRASDKTLQELSSDMQNPLTTAELMRHPRIIEALSKMSNVPSLRGNVLTDMRQAVPIGALLQLE